jgi:hypothetical protein
MQFTDDGWPLIETLDDAMQGGDGLSRGYDASVAGPFGSVANAAKFVRIPQSQYAQHIARQDRDESSPWHWFKRFSVPILNQGSWGFCTDEATEILTADGWRSWPDYDGHSPVATINPLTHSLEYQRPIARQMFDYNGKMLYANHNRMDFAVTPGHRMYVRKWNEQKRKLNDSYEFTTAENLGWYAGMLAAPSGGFLGTELVELEVEGDRRYDGDDFLAMLALVISDGYAGGSDSTKNWVSFCCFHPSRYDSVAALASRVGFTENPGRKGVWTRYDAGALANWIRANCYTNGLSAIDKRIPDIVKCASSRQILHFLTAYGDQLKAKPLTEFYTSSTQIADDIQELFFKLGKLASIGEREPKTTELATGKKIHAKTSYCIRPASSSSLSVERKKNIEQESYRGNVYCLTVPNGTLVTRRNKSILISGNCWMYGLVGAMQTAYAMAGHKPPHLNAHYPAWLGKNGANRGGWAGEGLGYVRRFGVPTMDVFSGHPSNRAAFDRGEVRASAELHKVVEFSELPRNDLNALCSVLLDPINPRPVTMGLNWWGHLVYAVKVTKDGVLIVNSWGERWGQQGLSVLAWNRSVAFEQIAVERVKPVAI